MNRRTSRKVPVLYMAGTFFKESNSELEGVPLSTAECKSATGQLLTTLSFSRKAVYLRQHGLPPGVFVTAVTIAFRITCTSYTLRTVAWD
jgi:hypothetical protein